MILTLTYLSFPGELPYIYSEVEYLKKKGNEALKVQDFQLALQHYSTALELLRLVPRSDELVATLLSNRSQAVSKMGLLDEALLDAESCISLRPTWNKVGSFVIMYNYLHVHFVFSSIWICFIL